ncbi:MAG: hypothetical protein U5N53_28385 [Mycobacterium sp.]|nr:hypothetical protein [Mycobacterium sp.]
MTNPLAILQVSTREHTMELIRDDGLYRHIRFKQPRNEIWCFDLVTWPGHLVITGDLEDFHFARTDDMFEFFRNPVGNINPGYWAEKLRGPQRFESYSFDLFKQHVYEDFRNWCAWHDGPHTPVWQSIRFNVLADDGVQNDESLAIAAAMDFAYRYPNGARFEFSEAWEWPLRGYDFRFLLSLHAIVWGIHWYDTVKAGGPDTPPETGVPTQAPDQDRPRRRPLPPPAPLPPRVITIDPPPELL